MNVFADPLQMTPEQWQRCFAVDLDGAWKTSCAALPGMLAQGAGSIVNIASVHGHKIIPGCFPFPVAEQARQAALLPVKRLGQPEEVAYTALFLASDEARFITATDILIDGGRSQLYHD